MKNLTRKMLGLLLAISMVSAILPVAVMATPVTDGHYIKLEELDNNGRNGFTQNNSVAAMSGGKVRVNWDSNNVDHYLDFSVDIPETGNYKIWVHGGTSNNNYVSPSKLVLDDTTDLNWETIQNSVQETGMSFRTAYHCVSAYLTAGTHTIKYVLTSARPSGDGNYAGAFDFMIIIPADDYTWAPSITDLPVEKIYSTNAWIEGESYTRSNYTSTKSGDGSDIAFSGNSILKLGSSSTQGYSEYDVELQVGTYDIYVRGGDNFNNGTWTSNVTPSVDGTVKAYTLVAYEGWPKWDGKTNNYDQGWVKVSDVALTKGTHTIRWEYLDSRVSSPTYYAGGIDCIAIVPSGAPFTPVEKNITNTKLDYYMSLLLLGRDLTNVTTDITLPSTLADGTAVTWSSNNTSVITNNGAVTRPINEDATVTLTATAGGYSKNFIATVSGEYIEEGPVKYAWIEGENYTRSNYSTTKTDTGCDITFSGNTILKLATKSTGYSEYDVDLQSGIYDIYVRGGDDFNGGTWTSNVTPSVDGTVKAYTQVAYEGWPKWDGKSNSYDQGWVRISNVVLSEGTHTIRWEYLDARASGNDYYMGGIDCIAIVPSGTQFTPIEKDIANTKLDYYMSLLLSGDLKALKGDVTLPGTALNGESITWTTSNSSIIATDGTVTRSESGDRWATLTATTASYTKVFDVKVKKLTDFDINTFTKSGNVGLGETLTASANLTYNKGASKDATVVIALYDEDNKLIMCGVNTAPATSLGTDITAEITIPLDCEDDLTNAQIKAFVWDDMKPIGTVLETVNDDFIITELGNEVDFHTDLMEKYLDDTYDSIFTYVDGDANISKPKAVPFRWEYLRDDKANVVNYTLKISENANMSGAKEYTANTENAEVYNLKVGTTYYWTVTANYADSSVTSPVSKFVTKSHAPRTLYVDGTHNVRDLGGWATSDGKRVKQGLIYRSFRLTHMSDGTFKQDITAAGIATMRNDLGIKSEIDLRGDDEMPIETYTESILGADVNYYRKPFNYNGDYLDESNRAALKDVFEIFADPSNYPIDFHCAAGADRTGMVAYFLNGLLGVSQEDLYRDYLMTNFISHRRPLSNITGIYVKTLNEYRGTTLQEKIYNYLSEVVGVSQNDLDFIISYMKE